MGEGDGCVSMAAWYRTAKTLAYGELKLKPWELEELSVFDFNDMVDAVNDIRQARRWETAYWVANIISPHLKRPAKAETLMKPFLKEKSKEERAQEREDFFAEFEKPRKEAENGR